MMPLSVNRRVVIDRLQTVSQALQDIRSLPLADQAAFLGDVRNVWTAESCLRRSLEALLDIGRHILAKAYGTGVGEYKEIARGLQKHGVLDADTSALLVLMAGYRNRMVHFYHEVSHQELYGICATRLDDIERIAQAYRSWLALNPQLADESASS